MKLKTKLLITTSNFDTAGSGKVIYDLINGLDKTKFDISIACAHNRGSFFRVVEGLGLPIYIFDTKTSYRPYWSLLTRINKIKTFFKNHDFDIVHSWQWSNDWTEAIAARLAGAKWIYTKKAMGFKSKHWKIKSFLADYIITINDEMKGYFPLKKRQRLIPLGIDVDYYHPKYDKSYRQNEYNCFHIITVANLVPVKGVEVLIDAVKRLENYNLKLTILGSNDNDYGHSLKVKSQELHLDDRITFIDKKPDVRPYIWDADLYVIPTLNTGRKEGMPMALVETMSMGIPVLGSNISGINFVLKDFKDLLFEAGNSEALSRKIIDIINLEKHERQNLGETLRTYSEKNFGLTKFISSHEDLYRELVQN